MGDLVPQGGALIVVLERLVPSSFGYLQADQGPPSVALESGGFEVFEFPLPKALDEGAVGAAGELSDDDAQRGDDDDLLDNHDGLSEERRRRRKRVRRRLLEDGRVDDVFLGFVVCPGLEDAVLQTRLLCPLVGPRSEQNRFQGTLRTPQKKTIGSVGGSTGGSLFPPAALPPPATGGGVD